MLESGVTSLPQLRSRQDFIAAVITVKVLAYEMENNE